MMPENDDKNNPAPRDVWTPARYRASEVSKGATRRYHLPDQPANDPSTQPPPPIGH